MARLREESLPKTTPFISGEGIKGRFKVGSAKLFLVVLGLIIPALILLLWFLVSHFGVVAPNRLPAPAAVAGSIIGMAQNGELWTHMSITLYRVFIGFLLGTGAAVLLGALVGFNKTAERLWDPLIQALRSIPSLAWVPLFILWMGIGEPSKVTLIAVGVFFPVYLNLVSGIQGVDRKLVEVGRIYSLSPLQQLRRIILPAALPSFLVGLRGGLGLGWMFVVAAELLGTNEGLGYLLSHGRYISRPDLIIASIILFAILGKLTDSVLKGIETKTLHWQDSYANKK